MLRNNYGRLPKPYQLLRDMLRTYWDESFIPRPIIVERPLPEYMRMDTYNQGAHLIISAEDVQEELMHIGFTNLDISVPMNIEILTAGTPAELGIEQNQQGGWERHELLYDYAREIQRIILSNQHDPNVYLLDNFETTLDTYGEYLLAFMTNNNNNNPNDEWQWDDGLDAFPDDTVNAYGDNSLRVVSTGSSPLSIRRRLPTDQETSSNPLPLIPRPGERLRALKFFAGTNDSAGVNLNIRFKAGDVTVPIRANPIRLADKGSDNTLVEYFIMFPETEEFMNAIMPIRRMDNLMIEFEIPANATVWLDHISLSTCEYQMLLYQRFQEDLDDFDFHSGITRAVFRSVGEPIDRFV